MSLFSVSLFSFGPPTGADQEPGWDEQDPERELGLCAWYHELLAEQLYLTGRDAMRAALARFAVAHGRLFAIGGAS